MKRKFYSTALFTFSAFCAFAQETVVPATKGAIPKLITDMQNYLVLMTILILTATILVLVRVVRSLTEKLAPLPKPVVAAVSTVAAEKRISFWERINRKFINDAVPVEREADVMLDHDYDGIKELDNNLPPWWKYGFYITIIWAFFYMVDYHVVGKGNVMEQEYAAQLAEAEVQKKARLLLAANSVDENTVTTMSGASDLSGGKKIYMEKCMVCHGKGGEGTVGPNLTDDYWIHGGKINDVFRTIKYGVPAKGMLAWQGQLTPVEMQQVASYIKSIYGTNPVNPKAPQGDLYSDVAASAPLDSTVASVSDSVSQQ